MSERIECASCGFVMDVDEAEGEKLKYCLSCGAPLSEAPSSPATKEVKCHWCGDVMVVPEGEADDLKYCLSCGASLDKGTPSDEGKDAEPGDFEYGGFWRRAGALIIDVGVLSLLTAIIAAIANAVSEEGFANEIAGWIVIAMWLLYFPLFEISGLQSTPGKRVLGLAVIDLEGQAPSAGRIILRNIVKLLSCYIPLLFLVAAFQEEKRALHDFAGQTYVVRRPVDWAAAGARMKNRWQALGRYRKPLAAGAAILVLVIIGMVAYNSRVDAWRVECGQLMLEIAQEADLPLLSIDGELSLSGESGSAGPEEEILENEVLYNPDTGPQKVFDPDQDVRSKRAPALFPWSSSELWIAHNPAIQGFRTALRIDRDHDPRRLVVLAEAGGPEIRDFSDIIYTHDNRAWVLTADGSVKLVDVTSGSKLKTQHRTDLYREEKPIVNISALPTAPSQLKQRLALSRPADMTRFAPLECRRDDGVRIFCQYASLPASVDARIQMRVDFTSAKPHTGNMFSVLGLRERPIRYATDAGEPSGKAQERTYLLNCGKFKRVDALLDDDGVTIDSLFCDTNAARLSTSDIETGLWHLKNSVRLWVKAAGDLRRSGTKAPDRSAIMHAKNVAWIVTDSAREWHDGKRVFSSKVPHNYEWPMGKMRAYGDFEKADIVVALYDYEERYEYRSPYYHFEGVANTGGHITYYRNSVRLAIMDADNPDRLLMLKHMTARPEREGWMIRRWAGWDGEKKTASSELAGELRSTLKALQL